uniref:DUF834 domain-containing protein n=1 Tax=Oryza brachyantha TaxID=4533 RepID=J3LK26_ORYBR
MSGSANERKDEAGVSDPAAAVGEEEEERRWSGSLHRGTWSSVTVNSTPPTPGAKAATEDAEAAVGERCCMAAGTEPRARGHGGER